MLQLPAGQQADSISTRTRSRTATAQEAAAPGFVGAQRPQQPVNAGGLSAGAPDAGARQKPFFRIPKRPRAPEASVLEQAAAAAAEPQLMQAGNAVSPHKPFFRIPKRQRAPEANVGMVLPQEVETAAEPQPEEDGKALMEDKRRQQEDACLGQLRKMVGGIDQLPPGEVKFALAMQAVAPLWLPLADVREIEQEGGGAHEVLAALLERFEGSKLRHESTPVARRAVLRFLQACM